VDEIPQQRIDFVVPAPAAEYAVMADAGLHVMHLAVGAHAGAEVLRRQRLADGTGWHKHECDFQIVIMTKGWARFMYEDKPTLVQAGDVVHQRPGIVHYLYDYSPDMEYLEIVSPADFKTVDMPPATDKVPPVTPWK
jgi:mannose-6-phosphate isomerase-like protein (cupin superfamily)